MDTLGDWLDAEPFTLTMSSGFFAFFAHAGMACALADAGLRPARITGTSAGALVGSALASGLSAREALSALLSLRREDFWDPAPGLGLLRGALFRKRLADLLPAADFDGCCIPFAVSVHQWRGRRTRVIAEGELVPAVYASCAVPLLFHPIALDGRLCCDGGVTDRWGLAPVASGTRVLYHHIGSRSPWRRADDPGLRIPQRENMAALELFGIPRSGPSKLALGAQIAAAAREAASRALDRPVGTTEQAFRTVPG